MKLPGRLVILRSAAAKNLLLLLTLLPVSCAPPHGAHIVIGAKNFTEQVVLGELLAQEIEAHGGGPVERRFYLAGSYIAHQALIAGRIDGYVEYTGTALTAILKQPLNSDAASVRNTTARLYEQRFHVHQFASLGFENTFAMVVRPEETQSLPATTLSAAVPAALHWKLGVGYEFESRPDGLPRLESTYGIRFAGEPETMDLGLLYRALASRQVDIIAANSTDGQIAAQHLAVLEDDKHAFPPYEAVPLFRDAALQKWPQIAAAMQVLAGKVTEQDMRAMNEAVDTEHRDVGDVVRAFRASKGL